MLPAPTQSASQTFHNFPRAKNHIWPLSCNEAFHAFPYERQLCASLPAEQLKNLVYIDKMFPCTESSFLTCENRPRVVCANSGTYKWHSCVLRSQVENLAYSNFASFTSFIMSSLTVLPYGLLGLCHSWFSFNGVNQEVTVKLIFVTAAVKR